MGWAGSISKATINYLREELKYVQANIEIFHKSANLEVCMQNPTYMYFFGKSAMLKELDARIRFTDENLWPIK